jgi:hypothetical protein
MHRVGALLLEVVDAAGSLGALDNHARLLQQTEVTRHRGAADGQCFSKLTDREISFAEQAQNLPAVAVTKGFERI